MKPLLSKITLLAIVFTVWIQPRLMGQSIGKSIKEIKTKSVTQVSVDRLGNFFVGQQNGVLKKYDLNGKLLASGKATTCTLLEPWYHPVIFQFDKKKQQITTSGRNFENSKIIKVDPAWAISPILVCPTNDNKLWLYDEADASLKKINPLTSEVILEFAIDTTQFKVKPNFIHLREYQSMIFLLDINSGIYLLNNIGKQINKIEKAGIKNFNFFGEELYYLANDAIVFYDLYTEEERKVKVAERNQFVIVTDERVILFSARHASVFEFNPTKL
jgi:hypothetical protein